MHIGSDYMGSGSMNSGSDYMGSGPDHMGSATCKKGVEKEWKKLLKKKTRRTACKELAKDQKAKDQQQLCACLDSFTMDQVPDCKSVSSGTNAMDSWKECQSTLTSITTDTPTDPATTSPTYVPIDTTESATDAPTDATKLPTTKNRKILLWKVQVKVDEKAISCSKFKKTFKSAVAKHTKSDLVKKITLPDKECSMFV